MGFHIVLKCFLWKLKYYVYLIGSVGTLQGLLQGLAEEDKVLLVLLLILKLLLKGGYLLILLP